MSTLKTVAVALRTKLPEVVASASIVTFVLPVAAVTGCVIAPLQVTVVAVPGALLLVLLMLLLLEVIPHAQIVAPFCVLFFYSRTCDLVVPPLGG